MTTGYVEHGTVELRSDTFTRPTTAMRRAMAEAEVGDDVWGEDPTANALEAHCAALLGKEAGLFVPSGSMGNEAAIYAQVAPGDEILVESAAHIMDAELGAPAVLSRVMVRGLRATRGVFDLDSLDRAILSPGRFASHTTLVCLENTHQASGGAVVGIDDLRAMVRVIRARGVRIHMDGARLFNAAVASGVPASAFAAEVDTLSFCFSKGLGAPVGSMLVGPAETIAAARRARKLFGGGMRQVGILCAAARIAVDSMVDRLAEDHANARALAEGIAAIHPRAVDVGSCETNIVYVDTGAHPAQRVVEALAERDVRVAAMGAHRIRCVTHKDVDAAGIARAIAAFEIALG